jgi:hypothetical protein
MVGKGLNPEMEYAFRLAAFRVTAGTRLDSGYSRSSPATTDVGVVAAPTVFSAVATSTSSVMLEWAINHVSSTETVIEMWTLPTAASVT